MSCCIPGILHATVPDPGGGGGTSFPTNMNSWSFADTNTWQSDKGYAALSFTNIALSHEGNIFGTFSVLINSTNPAWLQYNVFEADGKTNLTVDNGTLILWFSPNWASATTNHNGSGPGSWGRLIDVGAYTTNASYGWWSLLFDGGGTNLYFSAQTNSGDGAVSTYLSAPIDWGSNQWHMIAVTYAPTGSAFYIDGALATSGSGVSVYPGMEVLTNGFLVGSDYETALAQARGTFDDIATYDFPLDAQTIASLYGYYSGFYMMNPFNWRSFMSSGPSSPVFTPTFNAVTGTGRLTPVTTNTLDCVSSSNIWLTNIVATMAGTNMSLTFTIAGGSNGVPYDVFANNILTFSSETATAWAWMGQGYHCVTYTLTNLPPNACFLILGTPIDSDADGLTDAFEKLVSKTDPNNPDTDGDGLLDGWEVLWGTNPNLNDSAQSSSRANYTYDLSGWLNAVFGIRGEGIAPDNEGNVQTAQ